MGKGKEWLGAFGVACKTRCLQNANAVAAAATAAAAAATAAAATAAAATAAATAAAATAAADATDVATDVATAVAATDAATAAAPCQIPVRLVFAQGQKATNCLYSLGDTIKCHHQWLLLSLLMHPGVTMGQLAD